MNQFDRADAHFPQLIWDWISIAWTMYLSRFPRLEMRKRMGIEHHCDQRMWNRTSKPNQIGTDWQMIRTSHRAEIAWKSYIFSRCWINEGMQSMRSPPIPAGPLRKIEWKRRGLENNRSRKHAPAAELPWNKIITKRWKSDCAALF